MTPEEKYALGACTMRVSITLLVVGTICMIASDALRIAGQCCRYFKNGWKDGFNSKSYDHALRQNRGLA